MEALPRIPRPEPPPLVHTLYEELTETWQYVVADPTTQQAIIIDPHLDNGPSASEISTIAADRVLNVVRQNRYKVEYILHTHEPTQHPSSAWYLRTQIMQSTGIAPTVSIGRKMAAVQRVFKRKYSMNDGSQWRTDFEGTFADGQVFKIGTVSVQVLHFNGGNLAFVIGQHVFAGVSKFDLEVRNRFNRLLGELSEYKVHTSRDAPPSRTARLVPVIEEDHEKARKSKKLVIKYAAEIAGLEG